MAKKSLKKIANLICGCGECFCGYDCGHSNKVKKPLPLIGQGTVCPLAKYNSPVDTRPFWEHTKEDQLTENDCWRFCEKCEHAEIQADGTIHLKDFDTHCIDCPVHAVRDNLVECAAEAGMS